MTNSELNPTEQSSLDSPDNGAVSVVSPGLQLQKARLAKGVDIDAAASELNIPEKKLLALESDQFDQLASPTFVKGYLRSYCRYLELDANEIIGQYDSLVQEQVASESAGVKRYTLKMQSVEKPIPEWNWAIIGGVVLFVGLAAYFLWGDKLFKPDAPVSVVAEATQERTEQELSTPVQQEPTPAEPTQQQEPITAAEEFESTLSGLQENEQNQELGAALSEQGITSVNVATDDDNRLPEPESTSATSAAPASSSNDQAVTSQPSAESQLVFEFNDDCWVEVSDAAGNKLHQGIGSADTALTVVGDAPFSIMLGNVRAATIAHNGKPVDIKPIPGRKTLRFVVGEGP